MAIVEGKRCSSAVDFEVSIRSVQLFLSFYFLLCFFFEFESAQSFGFFICDWCFLVSRWLACRLCWRCVVSGVTNNFSKVESDVSIVSDPKIAANVFRVSRAANTKYCAVFESLNLTDFIEPDAILSYPHQSTARRSQVLYELAQLSDFVVVNVVQRYL